MQTLCPREMLDTGVPLLVAGNQYALHIPMPSSGYAKWNIDIASDYAWALFAINELEPHVERLTTGGFTDQHPYALKVIFVPTDTAKCREAIERIVELFNEDQPTESEDVRIAALEFENELAETPKVAAPDLGDSFLANYVHGLPQVLDDEGIEQQYTQFPAWRFGYWKSFLSHELGGAFYASNEGWILPRGADPIRLLRTLGWGSAKAQIVLQPAQLLRSGSRPWILVNDKQCLYVPVAALNNAAACWQFAIQTDRPDATALTFEFGEAPPGDYLSAHTESEWLVSGDGSIVIVRFRDVQLLTFLAGSAQLRPEETADYLAAARDVYGALAVHCLADNPVDWSQLDAGEFEELCYEVLLRCERFDPERMRKIGNVRSRDGGRDIEAWTHERPGVPAEKWIYQCKFSSGKNASLTGLNTSVSDVVDQFGADGYGVMTNMLIDATLYDKLDGMCRTREKGGRRLHIQTWSRLELGRFLNARVDLLSRFFKKSSA